MQVKISASSGTNYKRVARKMVSPLCGLNPRIDFIRRSWLDPRFIVANAELAGVHYWLGRSAPPKNGYHIGGAGIFMEEALMRTLGETLERYAHLVAAINYRDRIVMTTYDELVSRREPVLSAEYYSFFSALQYERPYFPFQPFSQDSRMGWILAPSLTDNTQVWIPAQLLFIGYSVKQEEQEPWLLSAVTTGSAAHTNQTQALRSALLELIELDTVMGHWYSDAVATEILFDARTQAIERILEKQCYRHKQRPLFYWLSNPDLPGLTVACVLRQKPGVVPAVALGLGCSLSLTEAMYKALLEAVTVDRLSPLVLAADVLVDNVDGSGEIDPQQIFDLDQNVAFYASHERCALIDAKFPAGAALPASDLPADTTLTPEGQNRFLIESFRHTGKTVYLLDLTTIDIRALGFSVLRAWSPATLGMCLPSFPPTQHPRFLAYGGCSHEAPHPYP